MTAVKEIEHVVICSGCPYTVGGYTVDVLDGVVGPHVNVMPMVWNFAEGSTGVDPDPATAGGFQTWLCLCNPYTNRAKGRITYMTNGGNVKRQSFDLAPGTRTSFSEGDIFKNTWSISARVESDSPISADRSMYWDAPGEYHRAATCSIGCAE